MRNIDEVLSILQENFDELSDEDQVAVLQKLILKCSLPQLKTLYLTLQPLIAVDFSHYLPQELISKIFGYLSAEDLSNVACCSKQWRDIANCDVLWHRLCENKGWLHYGTDHDLSSERPFSPSESSSVISSPTFVEENLIHFPSVLSQTCRWKETYIRASHLDKNWETGCYKVAPRLRGHKGKVTCLDSDGQVIVSGSMDSTVRVWDIFTGTCLHILEGHTDSVTCLQLLGSEIITGCADSVIRVYNVSSARCLKKLTGHEEGILRLKCQGGYLVTSAGDKTLRVWSWPSGKCQHTLRGHLDDIETFSLHNGLALSTSWDATCKVWDLAKGICMQTLKGHSEVVFCCQFDMVKAVTGGGDSLVKIWSLTSGTCTHTLEGHKDDVYCLQYDDDVIASGSADSSVRLWNHSGECLREMLEHIGVVRCLSLSNGRLVSGGDRKKIVVWDGKTGDLLNVVHRNPNLLHLMWVSDTKLITASPESPGVITLLSYW
ncbi:F-box/WD repeat-containing protein 7 [Holothuria leucospilota]|uniref:F-box/WD repeat-containing protein 7 n=1 Tax=Holothuria leucospilota TaxID=206669 RepID=A0A9Q1HHC2_HOLLE|nr:F-box/WD repeat-containing protein 7 [Holothuria leucospilota]